MCARGVLPARLHVLTARLFSPSRCCTCGTIYGACFRLRPTQYATEQRKPPLSRDPLRYELRMVDDDGEPDSDIPALDRTRELHKFGVDELALCTCTQCRMGISWHLIVR